MPDGQAQYLKVDIEDDSTGELIHISTETDASIDAGLEDGDNAVTMETTLAPVAMEEQEQEGQELQSGATPVEFTEDGQQVSVMSVICIQSPYSSGLVLSTPFFSRDNAFNPLIL